mmetsp:Transcript_44812/g.142696  ORF Transcript_44812/g.142696 Transcript_44812/m.142696 type:complete len:255 (+) Transcript_44812:114-878(+)
MGKKAKAPGKENKPSGKEKKLAKKAAAERAQAQDAALEAAYGMGSPVAALPALGTYERNGASLAVEAAAPAGLSAHDRASVMALLEANMGPIYGPRDWPQGRRDKEKEMMEEDARYLLCFEKGNEGESDRRLEAFVHYRFVVEEEVEVLYIYELQIAPTSQRKGVGKFLMTAVELWARKAGMRGVMLTVQKANRGGAAFYERLKYDVAPISPSRTDPLAGPEEYNYEIMSKVWDEGARETLMAQGEHARQENMS